jgi:hypothetical protein
LTDVLPHGQPGFLLGFACRRFSGRLSGPDLPAGKTPLRGISMIGIESPKDKRAPLGRVDDAYYR